MFLSSILPSLYTLILVHDLIAYTSHHSVLLLQHLRAGCAAAVPQQTDHLIQVFWSGETPLPKTSKASCPKNQNFELLHCHYCLKKTGPTTRCCPETTNQNLSINNSKYFFNVLKHAQILNICLFQFKRT